MKILDILKAPFNFFKIRNKFKNYWIAILNECIENDKLFEWFDKNDFQVVKNKFKLVDIVNSYDFLMGLSTEEIKIKLWKDYANSLLEIIPSSNLDLENVIYLWVNVDIDKFEDEFGNETTKKYFEVNVSAKNYNSYITAKNEFIKSLWFYIPITIIFSVCFGYLFYNCLMDII